MSRSGWWWQRCGEPCRIEPLAPTKVIVIKPKQSRAFADADKERRVLARIAKPVLREEDACEANPNRAVHCGRIKRLAEPALLHRS